MEQKTTLAQSMELPVQKAQYDAACKRVLAEKIILAWIMKHTMKEYAGYEVKEKEDYYDLMQAVMICLGGSSEEAEHELLRLLDVLLISDKDADAKKEILENEFQIPMTERMETEVESMCNLSDGVEQRGIEREHIRAIQKKIEKNKTIEQIADELELEISKVEKYF